MISAGASVEDAAGWWRPLQARADSRSSPRGRLGFYLRFISSVKPVGRSVSKAASQEVALLWKFGSVEAEEPPSRTLGL